MKTMICKTGGKNTINKQNNKPQGFNWKPWAVSSKSYSSGWSVASAIQFLLCFQAWGGTQELPILHFFSQAFEISQLYGFNCVSLPPLRKLLPHRVRWIQGSISPVGSLFLTGVFFSVQEAVPWRPNSFCSPTLFQNTQRCPHHNGHQHVTVLWTFSLLLMWSPILWND